VQASTIQVPMTVMTPNSSISAERMDSSQGSDENPNIVEFELQNEGDNSSTIKYLLQKVQELEATTSLPLKSRVYQGFVALAMILSLILAITANLGWSKNEELNKLRLQLKHVTDERDAMKLHIFDLELSVCPAQDELDALKLKYEDLFQGLCVERNDYRYPTILTSCFDHLARVRKNYAAFE
jgi:hypothetical protein